MKEWQVALQNCSLDIPKKDQRYEFAHLLSLLIQTTNSLDPYYKFERETEI
jgi:hypothetical protein